MISRAERLKAKIQQLQNELDSIENGIVHVYSGQPIPEINDNVKEIILHDIPGINCIEFDEKEIRFWSNEFRFTLYLANKNPNVFRVETVFG